MRIYFFVFVHCDARVKTLQLCGVKTVTVFVQGGFLHEYKMFLFEGEMYHKHDSWIVRRVVECLLSIFIINIRSRRYFYLSRIFRSAFVRSELKLRSFHDESESVFIGSPCD